MDITQNEEERLTRHYLGLRNSTTATDIDYRAGASFLAKKIFGIDDPSGRQFSGDRMTDLSGLDYYNKMFDVVANGNADGILTDSKKEMDDIDREYAEQSASAPDRSREFDLVRLDKLYAAAQKNGWKSTTDKPGSAMGREISKAWGRLMPSEYDALTDEEKSEVDLHGLRDLTSYDMIQNSVALRYGYGQLPTEEEQTAMREELARKSEAQQKYRDIAQKRAVVNQYRAQLNSENAWIISAAAKKVVSPEAQAVIEMITAKGDRLNDYDVQTAVSSLPLKEARIVGDVAATSQYTPSRGFWGDVAHSFGRTLGDVTLGAAGGIASFASQWFTDSDEYQRKAEMRALLSHSFEGRQGEWGVAGDAVIGFFSTMPYMGAAAIPYAGPALVIGSAMRQFEDEVAWQGGDVTDPDFQITNLLSGIAYWAVERMQFSAFEKLPLKDFTRREAYCSLFDALRGRVTREVGAKVIGTVAYDAAINTIRESAEEEVQKWIENFTIAHGLGKDEIGSIVQDIGSEFKDTLGTMFLTSLTGIGTQGVRYRHGAVGIDPTEAATEALRLEDYHRRITADPNDRRAVGEFASQWGWLAQKWANLDIGSVMTTDGVRSLRQLFLTNLGFNAEQAANVDGFLDGMYQAILAQNNQNLTEAFFDNRHVNTASELLSKLRDSGIVSDIVTADDGTVTGYTLNLNGAKRMVELDTDDLGAFIPRTADGKIDWANIDNNTMVSILNSIGMTKQGWDGLTEEERDNIRESIERSGGIRAEGRFTVRAEDGSIVRGSILSDVAHGRITLDEQATPTAVWHEFMHGVLRVITDMAYDRDADGNIARDADGKPVVHDQNAAAFLSELAAQSPRFAAATAGEAVNEEVFADAFRAYMAGKIDLVEDSQRLMDRLIRFCQGLFGMARGARNLIVEERTRQDALFNAALTGNLDSVLDTEKWRAAEPGPQTGMGAESATDEAGATGQTAVAEPAPGAVTPSGINLAETIRRGRPRYVLNADGSLRDRKTGMTYAPGTSEAAEARDLRNAGRWSFRVTPAEDAAYMDAVKRGDMKTAARMVREAAAKAMPDTKVVDEDGLPKVVYHGSDNRRNVFKMNPGAIGNGAYFTSAFPEACDYAREKLGDYDLSEDELEDYITEVFVNQRDESKIVNSHYGSGEIIVLAESPSQIKSADPVTYDDAGNVIPLSKRFNPDVNDIRYSVRGAFTAQELADTVTDITGNPDDVLRIPWQAGTAQADNGNPARYSVHSMLRGCGLDVRRDGKQLQVFIAGREISVDNPLTGEELKAHPSVLNTLLNKSIELGRLTNAQRTANTPEAAEKARNGALREADRIRDAYAGLVNTAVKYANQDLSTGAYLLDALWNWMGSEFHNVVKKNSDSQYGTSMDITTICKKNEALLQAVSQRQMELKRGLTPSEVMDLYLATGLTKDPVTGKSYQTPCPVCYVFSHWIRAGLLMETAYSAQEYYTAKGMIKTGDEVMQMNDDQLREYHDIWCGEYHRQATASIQNADIIKAAKERVNTIPDRLDELMTEYQLMEESDRKGPRGLELRKSIDALSDELAAAYKVLSKSDFRTFIKSFILDVKTRGKAAEKEEAASEKADAPDDDEEFLDNLDDERTTVRNDYVFTPSDVIFDFEKSGLVVSQYPGYMRHRLSKGSAGGKAIEEAAENPLGSVVAGQASVDSFNWAESAVDQADKKAQRQFTAQFQKAVEHAKAQSLIGGFRMFSWSDNRTEYGPDMFMNLLQIQMIGGSIQAYSKQLEGAYILGKCNAYVNCSLMGDGPGYRVKMDGNGRVVTDRKGRPRYELVFSDVQGIDHEGAFRLNGQFDRIGNILVGMNEKHIEVALADDRVFFVIPWHASGLGWEFLSRMMSYLGVDIEKMRGQNDDYTAVQSDGFAEDDAAGRANIAEFWRTHDYSARYKSCFAVDVVGDAAGHLLTQAQIEYRALRQRIFDGKASEADIALAMKDEFLGQVIRKMRERRLDKMRSSDSKAVYPFEYWDEQSTYKTADVNGERYLEYCRRLGVKPKFSGMSNNGEAQSIGNFTGLKGFWKLLIDRRMYDRKGKYQDTTPVDMSAFDAQDVDPMWINKNFPLSQRANKQSAPAISEKGAMFARARGQKDIERDMLSPEETYRAYGEAAGIAADAERMTQRVTQAIVMNSADTESFIADGSVADASIQVTTPNLIDSAGGEVTLVLDQATVKPRARKGNKILNQPASFGNTQFSGKFGPFVQSIKIKLQSVEKVAQAAKRLRDTTSRPSRDTGLKTAFSPQSSISRIVNGMNTRYNNIVATVARETLDREPTSEELDEFADRLNAIVAKKRTKPKIKKELESQGIKTLLKTPSEIEKLIKDVNALPTTGFEGIARKLSTSDVVAAIAPAGSEVAKKLSDAGIRVVPYSTEAERKSATLDTVEPARWSLRPVGIQKRADTVYPDASADIADMPDGDVNEQRFSFRTEARAIIEKNRPDIKAANPAAYAHEYVESGDSPFSNVAYGDDGNPTDGLVAFARSREIDKALDELMKFQDSKSRKAALHWFVNGAIRLPEDAPKVTEAIGYASRAKGKANTDPLAYRSPMEMIEALHDFKPKAKPINPDTVPELSDKQEMGNGVVTYLVQDDRAGQQAMRRIINTHWGEDANPWCLLHGDGKGNLSDGSDGGYDAWYYWNHYDALPKRVAFKDGKLLAFMATDKNTYGINIEDRYEELVEELSGMDGLSNFGVGSDEYEMYFNAQGIIDDWDSSDEEVEKAKKEQESALESWDQWARGEAYTITPDRRRIVDWNGEDVVLGLDNEGADPIYEISQEEEQWWDREDKSHDYVMEIADAQDEGRYSIVTDRSIIDEFSEPGKYIETYRTFQIVDGKLHSPMAAKMPVETVGKNGKRRIRWEWTDPVEFGKVYKADERPDIAVLRPSNGKYYVTLNKGNGTSLAVNKGGGGGVAYNPYWHSSNLVLNDQFTSAWNRPNLVTVKCRILKSDIESGYHAEKAHNPVGRMPWHTGTVAAQLENNTRDVYLSRFLMPVEIVDDSEVARMYKDVFGGKDIVVPEEVVPPNLANELRKIGVTVAPLGGDDQARPSAADVATDGQDAPDRKSIRLVGPRYSGRAYATAIAARDEILGTKHTPDDMRRLLDAFGLVDVPVEDIVSDGKALVDAARNNATSTVDLDRLAAKADAARLGQIVNKMFTKGARTGVDVGTRATEAYRRAVINEIAHARGADLQQFMSDTAIDLANIMLGILPKDFSGAQDKAKVEDREKGEAGGESDVDVDEPESVADMSDEEFVEAQADAEAAQAELEKALAERRAQIEQLRDRLRERLNAWRADEAKRRAKLEAERAAKEAAKSQDKESQTDDEDEAPGDDEQDDGNGTPEVTVMEADDEMPDYDALVEEITNAGFDLRNAGEVAFILRAYVEDWLASVYNTKPETVLRDPVAFSRFQKTMLQALRDLADRMLDPSDGAAAKLAERFISDIPAKTTVMQIEARARQVIGFVQNHGVRQSRRQLLKKLRADIKLAAVNGKKFDPMEKDVHRKVYGDTEQWARYLRRVINMTDGQMAKEADKYMAVIDGRNAAYQQAGQGMDLDALAATDAEVHKAMVRLQVLNKWGGLRKLTPAEIKRASEEILTWLTTERTAHDAHWQAWHDELDAIAKDLQEAVRARNVKFAPDDPNAGQKFADEMIMTLRQRLERITAGGGEKARNAIAEIMRRISIGSERLAVTQARYAQETEQMLEFAVEASDMTVRDLLALLDSHIPEELNEQLITDKQKPRMTWGQAAQLYASLCQTATYNDNITEHGRQGQRELIESHMPAEIVRLVERMRNIYDSRRDELSNEMFMLTGMQMLQPDPMYAPVKMFRGASDNLDQQINAWNPFGPSFTPRIKNRLDFDLDADIMSMYLNRSASSARAVAFGVIGTELRSILARRETQNAINQNAGKFATRRIIEQVTDTLTGGFPHQQSGFMPLVRSVSSFTTYTSLSWNLVTMLKQMTSIPAWDSVLDEGMGSWFRYMTQFDTDAAKEFIGQPGFIARYGAESFRRMLVNAFNNKQDHGIVRFYKAGMTAVQIGDFVPGLIVGTGVYKARRDNYVRQGMDIGEAIRRAATETWDLLEECQQSSRPENQGNFVRRAGPFAQQLVKFASSPMLQASHEIHAIRMWREAARAGDQEGIDMWRSKAFGTIFANHILIPAAMYAVATLFGLALGEEPPEDDEVYGDLMVQCLLGSFGRIFFVGAIMESVCNSIARGCGLKPSTFERNDFAAQDTVNRLRKKGMLALSDLADGNYESSANDMLDVITQLNRPANYAVKAARNYLDYDPKKVKADFKKEQGK